MSESSIREKFGISYLIPDEKETEIKRLRAALSSRDAEIREVLEGLINKRSDSLHLHWCHPSENCNYACAAARAIYDKLRSENPGSTFQE